MSKSPYSGLPPSAFWRPAVAESHIYDIKDIASPLDMGPSDRVATAGSCFAQHIARHLRLRGSSFVDMEPAPAFLSQDQAKNHGYGLFSCRYGNVYTVRQLLQLMEESLDERTPADLIWSKNGRYYDALRPSVDPAGHDSPADVLNLRSYHLSRVRQLWSGCDWFVFTLGLTEGWESAVDGTVYPTAPATIAGSYDPEKYRLHNFRYDEIISDLRLFLRKLRKINPRCKLLLTVSPVPLTATASGQHILVANMYSKSTLRAVAGDMVSSERDVYYFPSYELIASHPARAMFFNHDLRTVNAAGVEYVMTHFFRSEQKETSGIKEDLSAKTSATEGVAELVCDDEKLEQFSASH